MPYPTVILQAGLANHIQTTIANVNTGLYNWNMQSGQQVKMPPEIKFDCIVIDQFQALPVVSNDGGTNTTLQTGTDTAVTSGTTTDAPPMSGYSQVTTHGETVNTSSTDTTNLTGYDPTAVLNTVATSTIPNITAP